MKTKKDSLIKVGLLTSGLIVGLLLGGFTNEKPELESKLVTVGNKTISKNDHYDMLRSDPYTDEFTFGDVVLEEYIFHELLEQKYSEHVSDEYVEDQMKNIMAPFESEEEFDKYLKEENIKKEDLISEIRNQEMINLAFTEYFPIEEEELKKTHEENFPIGMLIQHVLVKDESTAKEVINKLNNGADFTELVFEYSLDEASFDRDGTYTMVKDYFIPEFESAALALNEGEYTEEPVKTESGYHVIKMKSEGVKFSYEEARDDLIREAYEIKAKEDPTMYRIVVKNILEENKSNIKTHDESTDNLVERIVVETERIVQETHDIDNSEDDAEVIETREEIKPLVTPEATDE